MPVGIGKGKGFTEYRALTLAGIFLCYLGGKKECLVSIQWFITYIK